jgi:hypothetical protein
MLDGDSFIYDPLALCLSNQDKQLPGKRKTLRERFDEDVLVALQKWVAEFAPMALKEKRANDAQLEQEKHEAVQAETKSRAKQLSLIIQAAIVDHPDFEAKLKPRFGSSPDEHVANLVDMRNRLDQYAADLKAEKIEIRLDERHSHAAVTKQAAAHAIAQQALDLIEKHQGTQQGRLVALRKEGRALQKLVNEQLVAALPGNRPAQIDFGYSERETQRPHPKTEKKTEKKPEEEKKAAPETKTPETAPAKERVTGPAPVVPAEAPPAPAAPPSAHAAAPAQRESTEAATAPAQAASGGKG